jgi:hypothetical protein
LLRKGIEELPKVVGFGAWDLVNSMRSSGDNVCAEEGVTGEAHLCKHVVKFNSRASDKRLLFTFFLLAPSLAD